jgi:hypothetical protein
MAVPRAESKRAQKAVLRTKTVRVPVIVRRRPRFAEFCLVRALKEIRERNQIVPAGSVGTVVDVVRGGAGYIVEFTLPNSVVVSARPSELTAA